MKRLFLLILSLSYISISAKAAIRPQQSNPTLSVEVYSYDHSLSYTLRYKISKDSLIIQKPDGLQTGHFVRLFAVAITSNQANKLHAFINTPSFLKLKNEYIDHSIGDGDHKQITTQSGGKIKNIKIANVYVDQIAQLFDIVNGFVKHEYRIKYYKKATRR